MKSDTQIQKDIIDQLAWEPYLNKSQIGVSVKNGIVTLTGQVDSYPKKLAVENAAKKIAGVKAIAEDLQLGVTPVNTPADTEIAAAILDILKWDTAVREEKIKIEVENGNVKLEGEVEWEFERRNAEAAIEGLKGVRSVKNCIIVKPRLSAADIKQKIIAAFERNAVIDARKIDVDVADGKVTLRGTVRSFAEKKDAEDAVWFAPGVSRVESRIELEAPEHAAEYQKA